MFVFRFIVHDVLFGFYFFKWPYFVFFLPQLLLLLLLEMIWFVRLMNVCETFFPEKTCIDILQSFL